MLSLLGITAHVYAADGSCIRSFGLELVELQESHTADYVYKLFQDVLEQLKLGQRRTFRVVTVATRNVTDYERHLTWLPLVK